MTPLKPHIFYFRSLNTGGDDRIRFGPLRLGSFSSRYEKEFASSSLDFIPVTGMGAGPLSEQAEKAKEFLEKTNFRSLPPSHVHFYGHSAGGLIAKLIAADPVYQSRLRSLITIGTPHRGCSVAHEAAVFSENHPRWSRACRLLGYDFTQKQKTFESFDEVIQQDFSFPPSLKTGSIVCAPPRTKWSAGCRLARHFPVFKEVREPCDGWITKDAQIFGTDQWEFELDHLQQIGIGGQKEEFKKLCRFLETTWTALSLELL